MVSSSCDSKETEKVQTSALNNSTPNRKLFNQRQPLGGIRALKYSDKAESIIFY